MLSAPAERIVRTFVPVKRNARALYPVRNNARPSRLCREKQAGAPLRRPFAPDGSWACPSTFRLNLPRRTSVLLRLPRRACGHAAKRVSRSRTPPTALTCIRHPRELAHSSRLCQKKCTVAPLRRLLSHSRPMRAAASSVDEFAEAAPQGRAARRRTRAGSGECARTPLFAFGTPAGRWQGSRSPDVA